MYVTCMLHVWATCNMAQSLCTRAIEPHHVIRLYVFAKYVSVLYNSDTPIKQYEYLIKQYEYHNFYSDARNKKYDWQIFHSASRIFI